MIDQIKNNFEAELLLCDSIHAVEELKVKYIGKNGILTDVSKKIVNMLPEERRDYGAKINNLKSDVAESIAAATAKYKALEIEKKLLTDSIDVTLPVRPKLEGVAHPIMMVQDELRKIFAAMGFKYEEGLEIEDDWHNFTALNIADDHPARQMHDTFYIESAEGKDLLLRTHTSNVQIRVMKNAAPPYKFITMGKTFRSDSDATHSPMFHQMEAVYVDKFVNLGHLKYCLEHFLARFFNKENIPMRMRASHFPFTEPSIEVDIRCDRSDKNNLIIGQGSDWIEILGCGMIHPNVLKNCGIDPSEYQGFALGAGIERLAMLKYGISDLRKFFDGDIRWLSNYGGRL